MPPLLVEFLQGEARWDARLAAWLLWLRSCSGSSPLWRHYFSVLPAAAEMTCLLNYAPKEQLSLELPFLIDEARAQHEWAVFLHDTYFSSNTGTLAVRVCWELTAAPSSRCCVTDTATNPGLP